MRPTAIVIIAIAMLLAAIVPADACTRADALGTSRLLVVDPQGLRVGKKQFPRTLDLAPRELVLTFDDGPMPGTTPRVLDTLAAECVKATFFLIGRNAAAHPALARRIVADGHTVAHHSMTHPTTLERVGHSAAVTDIERGIEAVERAAYGDYSGRARVPFFRFPGFGHTPALLDYLDRKGFAVFGADLWASDWISMAPHEELSLVLQRIESAGRGIVLFHDTRAQTASMLPALLRELKRRNFRIVHVVPAGSRVAAQPPAPATMAVARHP